MIRARRIGFKAYRVTPPRRGTAGALCSGGGVARHELDGRANGLPANPEPARIDAVVGYGSDRAGRAKRSGRAHVGRTDPERRTLLCRAEFSIYFPPKISTAVLADPNSTKLQTLEQTSFRGTTLRGCCWRPTRSQRSVT